MINKLLCFMCGHVPQKYVWIKAAWEHDRPEMEGKTFNFCKRCGKIK